MHENYAGQGVDQLAHVIDLIRSNPCSRRIVMSAWNPVDIPKMVLPPCHVLVQFYVSSLEGTLSCHLYQRSADMGLGVPFNIASYALLLCLVAHVCHLKPGELVHSFGDCHVYVDHVSTLKTQLEREVRPLPSIRINPAVKDLFAIQASDIELLEYHPHPKLVMTMAV